DWEPYAQPMAAEGAPSVLYVVLDDVGFAAMEPFGGVIETPNINRIADKGLVYTNFHTTALCSPTRSCLLTGRNHTTNSMACITEAASGFPNASGHIPGKDAKVIAPDKPFFLYYSLGAAHAPHHVPQEWADKYQGRFDEGYEAYREQVFAKQKELGIIPEHAELSPINPYTELKGPDGQDWGALDVVRPWDSLSDDEKRVFSRMAEVCAGLLSHADDQLGRVLD